ncbi:GON4L-like protein [Mya arenaria]|uniref:GON4L-like protein n=1 Tax=Mya arenaria TaxID=6604 RepID=A0ABY7DGL6_MYAAR|nr:GON4L-like protein [Mya arenaria]
MAEKMDEEKSPSVKAERKRVYKSIFGPQSDSSSESSSSSSSLDSDDEFSPQTGKLEVKNEIKENSKEESENTESVEDKRKNKMNPIKEECSASQKLTEESVSSGIPDLLSQDQKAMLKELLVNELKCAVDAVAGDKTDSADDSPDRPTQLYMGPYGKIRSPFKKVSSLQTYSKQCKETQSVEEGDSSDEEPGDTSDQQLIEQQGVVSGDESSEGEGLQIDESDQDMDGKLDGKSNKFALSAINVKSIIHKIITNESVVEMVRKAVQEEMAGKEFEYEPKLTRAKLKQFEAQGQVPVNWGLSPVKRPKAESPNFLEMELPEEEDDDEDFNPDKVVPESDEDSESVVSSSYVSDIGSPAPSTPLSAPVTPGLNDSTTRADITPTNLDSDISQQSLLSPMGPPLVVNVPRSNKKPSCLQQRFKDQTIFDLEANFVAPDISEDLYDTSCDDNDWKTFLVDFSRLQPDTTLTGSMGAWLDEDDEEADPEYNFLEEQEEFDHEDFRNDRAVKVSKREVNQLLDELYSSLGDNDPLNEDVRQLHSDTRKRYEQRLILEIGDGERRQIHDQMRKHVQLLTQTFVLAEGSTELQPVADTAAMYLRELHHFGSGSAADTQQRSHFWACNLPGSLELLNTYRSVPIPALTEEDRDRLDLLDFRHDNQVLPSLTHRQMFVMWTNKVFMFPDLLPAGAFFRQCEIKRDRSRVKFLDSEDNLLAMGLAQFHHLSDSREYIQRFMLPCKSLKQIQIRIKNLRANAAKDNAVKYWCKFKVLPRFPQCAPEFTPDMMKAPCDSGLNLQEMPAWCKFFSGEEEEPYLGRDLREIQKIKRRKRRARLNASLEKPDESMAKTTTTSKK